MTINPNEANIAIWDVIIDGPEGTPFIGGKFTVNLDFTNLYPFRAPKVKFMTKIYHPCVNTERGYISVTVIETKWVPSLNAKFAIEAILTLLKNPDAEYVVEPAIA